MVLGYIIYIYIYMVLEYLSPLPNSFKNRAPDARDAAAREEANKC